MRYLFHLVLLTLLSSQAAQSQKNAGPNRNDEDYRAFQDTTPPSKLKKLLGKADTLLKKIDEKVSVLNTPPKNLTPADNYVLSEKEAKSPIAFSWTPISPLPKEGVTYRFRLFEVKKGQSPAEAARANKVFEEKNIANETKLSCCTNPIVVWPIAADSKYGWNITAISSNGNVLGSSDVTTFSEDSPCSPGYKMENVKAECGADGKVHVTGTIVIIPKPTITVKQIALTKIKETNPSGANVSTSISTFPKVLTGSGNNYDFSFIINADMCNKGLYIGYNINYDCSVTEDNTPVFGCGDSIKNIPCCTCTFCDDIQWRTGEQATSVSKDKGDNWFINLGQPVSVPGQKIKSFKAEIISFSHKAANGNEECISCHTNSNSFGKFTNGQLTTEQWGTLNGVFPVIPTGAGNTHHTLHWFTAAGSSSMMDANKLNLTISVPPFSTIDCCDDEFNFCIRYTFTTVDCKTCSKVVCYTKIKRVHKSK